MRPQCDHILRTVGMVLATKFLPMLETEHARAELGLTALVMGVISEEFDRAAHRRVEENREIRKIFKEALSIVTDQNLKNRLETAVGKIDEDFHISALDQMNCELQSLFIELQAHLEALEGADAGRLQENIWIEIENQVKRREFLTWEVASQLLANISPDEPKAESNA
jgi:hypothetical protein